MKAFVVLSALLAIAAAKPANYVLPTDPSTYRYVIAPTHPLSVSYNSQGLLGQYAYGYNDGLSAKQEVRGVDGITRGSYSYIDANNAVQSVGYIADAQNGFRAIGTNFPKSIPAPELVLPQQVAETSEVAAARAAHLLAIQNAQSGSVPLPTPVSALDVELPQPVEDTPEVAAARLAHLAALREAELRNSAVSSQAVQPILGSSLGAGVVLPGVRYVQGSPSTFNSNLFSYVIVN